MIPNTGRAPQCELVNIVYRGGVRAFNIDPTKRRWTINDARMGGESDFDILSWERVK